MCIETVNYSFCHNYYKILIKILIRIITHNNYIYYYKNNIIHDQLSLCIILIFVKDEAKHCRHLLYYYLKFLKLMIESHLANIRNFYYVQNCSSPYDEYSSDDCVDKRWDRQRDLDESKASKAQKQSESEDSTETTTVDFYARQVCCRECG